MICKNCNAQINEGSRFCKYCEALLMELLERAVMILTRLQHHGQLRAALLITKSSAEVFLQYPSGLIPVKVFTPSQAE